MIIAAMVIAIGMLWYSPGKTAQAQTGADCDNLVTGVGKVKQNDKWKIGGYHQLRCRPNIDKVKIVVMVQQYRGASVWAVKKSTGRTFYNSTSSSKWYFHDTYWACGGEGSQLYRTFAIVNLWHYSTTFEEYQLAAIYRQPSLEKRFSC